MDHIYRFMMHLRSSNKTLLHHIILKENHHV